ncbi:hypothetical protein T03_2970 [Trichinella britovi]|uniref:Uncharacterized protein n=2 Tax=Trichinella TaxID=6333 RepID=A0A0V1C6R4_TRIBR|nr:hypothetical protein T03_17126 [Trichinella britovi]KRY44605.1 hypothetical protein T03_13475 [Trichinella britovi]KRY44760.1 hypothetical protein T03_2970 [Trichinella britovi]
MSLMYTQGIPRHRFDATNDNIRGFKSCNPPSQLGKLPIGRQFYNITNEHRVFDIQDVAILSWDLVVVLEFESHA